MKKILTALLALYLLVPAANAQQDLVSPPAIGVSFFLNDFATPSRIRSTSLSQVLGNHRWAKFREMNVGLGFNYIAGITKNIDFAGVLGGSFVKYPMPNRTFTTEDFLLEASATLNFKLLSENYWIQPYATVGIGADKYNSYYGAFMPLGIGFKTRFINEAYLFVNSQYRIPVITETTSYHFQHSIGIVGVIGRKHPKVIPPPPPPLDTDKDGIIDSVDKCPTVPGVAKYDGCPVPDTDKDGINDDEDKCPTVPGLARYQGCPVPDTDKDGINDDDDKCPTVPGVARYQGCPVPDTDGDGVNDEEDKCPTIPGPADNQGCPKISEAVKQRVDSAANNILFVTGSYQLLPKSFKGLNEVVKILAANPDMVIAIDGHTDNVGSDEMNQRLSDNRATAVKNYLVSKGVAESRITSAGHGETMPIDNNNTAAGRQKNRRVEMKLSYFK